MKSHQVNLFSAGFSYLEANVRAPLGCSSVPRPTRSTMVCQVMLPRARNLHYFKTSSNDDDDRNNIIPNANAFIFKTLQCIYLVMKEKWKEIIKNSVVVF